MLSFPHSLSLSLSFSLSPSLSPLPLSLSLSLSRFLSLSLSCSLSLPLCLSRSLYLLSKFFFASSWLSKIKTYWFTLVKTLEQIQQWNNCFPLASILWRISASQKEVLIFSPRTNRYSQKKLLVNKETFCH